VIVGGRERVRTDEERVLIIYPGVKAGEVTGGHERGVVYHLYCLA